jgi:hypothetical protein
MRLSHALSFGATFGVTALVSTLGANDARAQYSSLVLSDSPVAYYRFGEAPGATIAVDSAPASGANDGTIGSNVTLGQPGAIVGDPNTAFLFNNNTNSSVAAPRTISGNFSIEFWFNTTSNQFTGAAAGGQWYQAAGLVDMEVGGVTNDFGTSLAGGTVLFGVGNPDITIRSTSTALNNGAWQYVVATRDQTTGLLQLYINGVRESTGTTSNTAALNASSTIRIGALQTFATAYQGRLDEVALYDRVLTQAQVTAHYNAGITAVAAPEPGSVALMAAGMLPLAGVVARRRRSA